MEEKKIETKGNITQAVETNRSKRNFDDISFLILGIVVFLVPIFFLPINILGLTQTKISIISIGTIIAFGCFLIERMRKGVVTITFNPIYVSGAAVAVVYFVSSLFSIARYKSLIGTLTEQDTLHVVVIILIFSLLVSYLTSSQKRVMSLIVAFSTSVILSMIIKIALLFTNLSTPSIFLSKVDTLSGTWSELTLLSLLTLGMAVIVLETLKFKKWVYALLSISLVVPFFFVALSGLSFDFYFFNIGLGALIALVSVVLFAYMFSFRKMHAKQREEEGALTTTPKISASIVLLSISIVFVIFGSPINNFLVKYTGVSYVEGRPNWQATVNVAKSVLAVRPYIGSGPNTFSTEWELNKLADANNFPFWNNVFNFGVGILPTSLVTVGIIGCVAWLVFYFYVLMLALRTLFKAQNSNYDRVLGMIVSMVVIVSTFLMMFYVVGIVMLFANFLFIGLLVASQGGSSKGKEIYFNKTQWQNFVSTLLLIICVIGTVYWLYSIVVKDAANYYYRKSVLSSDTTIALVHIKSALTMDASNPIYYATLGQVYASKVAQMMALPQDEVQQKKEELNDLITNSINYSVFAESLDPSDFRLKIGTAKILEFYGTIGLPNASKGAMDRYKEASSFSPTNPLPYLYLANVSLSLGDKILAKEYLIKALVLKSNYTDVPSLESEIRLMVDKINKGTVLTPATSDTAASSTKAVDTKVKKVEVKK